MLQTEYQNYLKIHPNSKLSYKDWEKLYLNAIRLQ